MNDNFIKFKNWILASFQFITVGLLVFAVVLILKQQNEIRLLKSRIDNIESNTDILRRGIFDVKMELDDLDSDIDDVKRTIRLWCD